MNYVPHTAGDPMLSPGAVGRRLLLSSGCWEEGVWVKVLDSILDQEAALHLLFHLYDCRARARLAQLYLNNCNNCEC